MKKKYLPKEEGWYLVYSTEFKKPRILLFIDGSFGEDREFNSWEGSEIMFWRYDTRAITHCSDLPIKYKG